MACHSTLLNQQILNGVLVLILLSSITMAELQTVPTSSKFHCSYPRSLRIPEGISLRDLKQMVHAKLQAGSRPIADLYYRCLEKTPEGGFHFTQMTLARDDDVRRMLAVF